MAHTDIYDAFSSLVNNVKRQVASGFLPPGCKVTSKWSMATKPQVYTPTPTELEVISRARSLPTIEGDLDCTFTTPGYEGNLEKIQAEASRKLEKQQRALTSMENISPSPTVDLYKSTGNDVIDITSPVHRSDIIDIDEPMTKLDRDRLQSLARLPNISFQGDGEGDGGEKGETPRQHQPGSSSSPADPGARQL